VCGGQRMSCDCNEGPNAPKHDKAFARWTGLWPGLAEARMLGMDLNDFHENGMHKIFFIKPKPKEEEDGKSKD